MTWILMEIPCHFTSKSTAVSSKSTSNSMAFPCHLSRFYLFSMLKQDMDFGQSQVVEFPRHFLKNDGISIGFGLIFDQTAVKKTWENSCHVFYKDHFHIEIFKNHGKNINELTSRHFPSFCLHSCSQQTNLSNGKNFLCRN